MQMSSGIHFINAEDCLVTWLRDQLDPVHHADLASTWIVLPTRRLSGNLTASLAAMRGQSTSQGSQGSLIAPRSMNLDGFLTAAADSAPAHSKNPPGYVVPRALSPEMPELLIHALIESAINAPNTRQRRKHIDPSHSHELAHLISSAVDNMLPLDAIGPAATKILNEEIYRSEDQVCAMAERIQSIQETIQDFQTLLKKNSLETTEMRRARLAAQIAAIPLDGAMPWKRLVIAGFTSMVPAHLEMLRNLARRPDVTIVLTEPPGALSAQRKSKGETPLARLANHMRPSGKTAAGSTHASAQGSRPLQGSTTSHETSAKNPAEVTSWIAATREDEIALAIKLAQGLLAKDPSAHQVRQGVMHPAASVAILIPDETTYEPVIRKALEGHAPFNLAAPMPLTRTIAGSWFLHMAQFARLRHDECDEATRQSAAAFLTHPLMSGEINGGEQEADHAPVIACLAHAVAASPDIRSIRGQLNRLKNTAIEQIDAAASIVGRAMEIARQLRTKSVLESLAQELEKAAPSIDGDSNYSKDAHDCIERILHDLNFLAHQIPCKPSTLLDLFVQRIQSASVRDRGEPLTGLQILTLAEARHVPFHAVVIVGCNEGIFPRGLPKDRLLDQFLLRRLGLPTWEDLEAIEDTTFHLLRARLSKIVMTCSQRDAAKHLVPSRYIELMKNLHGIQPRKAQKQPDETFNSLPAGFEFPALPVEGRIITPEAHDADQAAPLSASALANLIACPFKYALDRQGAKPSPDYESEVKMRQGNWLHHSIREALDGFTPNLNAAGGVDPAAELAARLTAASLRGLPPELRETDIQAHLEYWSWPRLAEFTVKNWTLAPNSTPVDSHSELRFNVQFGGRQFHGDIDRFENLGPVWLLLDYKASNSPKRPEIDQGVRPQLAIYAHALAETRGLSLDHCIAGHFEIIKGNWVLGFIGESAKTQAIQLGLMTPRQKPSAPHVGIANAAALMQWREESLVADPHQYLPDQSQCGYCPHSNICRRDDDAAEGWFSNPDSSKMLTQMLTHSPTSMRTGRTK